MENLDNMSKRLDFCIDFRQICDQNQENLGKGDKKGTKHNKWRKITTLRAFATGIRELKSSMSYILSYIYNVLKTSLNVTQKWTVIV